MIGFIDRFPGRPDADMEIFYKILSHNQLPYTVISPYQSNFWEIIKSSSHVIYKFGHYDDHLQLASTILPIIRNELNIPVFPDYNTSWHYDDKIKQYFLLTSHDYPAVESFVFWNKEEALRWAEGCNYPVVFKLKGGAGSLSVILVKNKSQASGLIRRMFSSGIKVGDFGIRNKFHVYNNDPRKLAKSYAIQARNYLQGKDLTVNWQKHKNYAYFQKYLKGNEFDIRVTTAGRRVHAFRRFVREGDFRASGSNKWDIDPSRIDPDVVKIALDISTRMGFQAMAYDFIYDESGAPKIVEMSYLYGGAGYPDFMNGYWDENLTWHEGRYWPQYFELVDLLQMPDLKLPVLDTTTSYKKAKF